MYYNVCEPETRGTVKSKPKTIRLEEGLDQAVEQWTKINNTDFSKLVEMALREFIFSKKTIELQPVSMDEAMAATDRVMARHKKVIDELK